MKDKTRFKDLSRPLKAVVIGASAWMLIWTFWLAVTILVVVMAN